MVAESQFTFEQKLRQVRANAARKRNEAFVDYAPRVCGMTLQPVTLASYNRLAAFCNGFAAGGAVTLGDVLVWVWVHHPKFAQDAANDRQSVFTQASRALRPRFPRLNSAARALARYPRWRWLSRLTVATADERFSETVAEIRRIMAEAFYGFPPAEQSHAIEADDDGERNETFTAVSSVAFQAQILNTFRRQYGMSYAETEALPLKKLSQLWREHLFYIGGDKTGLRMMDADEAALWREQLAETNQHG